MRADESFRALANPTRRRILHLVRDDARPVGSLVAELEMTQPAVSQHLAVLREAGLVHVVSEGRRRLYRTDREAVEELAGYLTGYWDDALDRLAAAAEGRGELRGERRAS